jgi:membrane protease YdiL (CAAX protease family)
MSIPTRTNFAPLSALLVALSFVALRFRYSRVAFSYLVNLVRTKQMARFDKHLNYSDLGGSHVFGTGLAIALCLMGAHPAKAHPRRAKLSTAGVLAVVSGLLIPFLSLPITLKASEPLGMVELFVSSFTRPGPIIISALLLVALGFMSERLFRVFTFFSWRERYGLVAGSLAASLVSALCWPMTDVVTAFLLAMVACFLFEWTGRLWPGAVAYIVGTASCISILTWNALTRG